MKALVIGASGGFGSKVAGELLARGHDVRAVARPGGKVVTLPGAEVVEADALDAAQLGAAATGCDAIVFGYHRPYGRWDDDFVRAAAVSGEVAARVGATVLYPGNVYGLGPDYSVPLAEGSAKQPPTRMGALRNAQESALRAATEHGARVIILRAGDFIGPDTENSWLTMMTGQARDGGAIWAPAPDDVPHAWAYLPDVVRAGVDLLERRDALAPFEEVHFEGYTLTQTELLSQVRTALGDPKCKVRRVPWSLVRVLSWFSPLIRGVFTMRYLWQVPLRLDGSKLHRLLPDFTPTPLPQALDDALSTGNAR